MSFLMATCSAGNRLYQCSLKICKSNNRDMLLLARDLPICYADITCWNQETFVPHLSRMKELGRWKLICSSY